MEPPPHEEAPPIGSDAKDGSITVKFTCQTYRDYQKFGLSLRDAKERHKSTFP